MWTPFEEVEQELLKDPEIKQMYEVKREEYELVEELIKARMTAKMTQDQVAKAMGTSQSAIHRIEAGRGSLSSIRKYAKATGKKVKITLV